MPLRFRVLPTEDGRPDGEPGAAGPLVERAVELPDASTEIRLGRRADVELPLPFAVLSGVHARLTRLRVGDGLTWAVEDLSSTNGTWLDGARLVPGHPRPLAPGAELRLGTVRVCFDGDAAPTPAADGTATLARRLVADLFGDAGDGAPTLRVLRGAPAGTLRLAVVGRGYVVGRVETCALALPVEEVSREHATFVRRAEGVFVRDHASKNGVLVGGVRITAEHPLTDGDTVTIGPVTLRFDDPVTRYLRELEQAPAAPAPPAHALGTPGPAALPPRSPAASHPARRKVTTSQLAVAVAVVALALLAVAAAALFL